MSASLMHGLVATTLASSIAVVCVGALRKPLRRLAGSQSAYWLWLLVPAAALAVFLPAPTYQPRTLPDSLSEALSYTATAVAARGVSVDYVKIGLATWLLGVVVIAALLMVRQRAFVRSLGPMTDGPDGVLYSDSIV